MRSTLALCTASLLLTVVSVAASQIGGGGPNDHLKCYKVRDSAAKTSYTATLTPPGPPFTAESGCVVKVPAKLLCVGVDKSAVSPTPPGAGPGIPLGEELFACYKLKCPKTAATFTVADQFGARSMTIAAPNILCAPAHTAIAGTCEASSAPMCGGTCPVNCLCQPLIGGGCGCVC